MRILILTAFWQRPEISRLYWMGIERLKENFDVKVMAIVSDPENLELAKLHSDYITEFPNNPLGKKMNVGLVEAMKHDFDVLMQLGSDDLISDYAVEKLMKYYRAGVKFFGLTNVIYFDSETKKAGQKLYPNVIGGGRCISKDILLKYICCKKIRLKVSLAGTNYNYGKGKIIDMPKEKADKLIRSGIAEEIEAISIDNLLWPDHINRALDVNSEQKLEQYGIVALPVMFDDPQLIDVKSNVNIWAYDHFKDMKDYPIENIKEKISQKEYDYLMSL